MQWSRWGSNLQPLSLQSSTHTTEPLRAHLFCGCTEEFILRKYLFKFKSYTMTQSIIYTYLDTGTCVLTNSVDPDEMPQNDARKFCLQGWAITKVQTSLGIHTVWSVPLLSIIGTYHIWTCYRWNFIFLASLCSWAGWFRYDLVTNPEDRFFCVKAHIVRRVMSEGMCMCVCV